MPAALISDLEKLIGLGFSPFLALIIAFLIVLAGVIATLAVFFWKQIAKERARQDRERAERDAERATWHREVEDRLDDCETDREALRVRVSDLDTRVARLAACPRRDCPMRLPP
jgi:hypothetical protein